MGSCLAIFGNRAVVNVYRWLLRCFVGELIGRVCAGLPIWIGGAISVGSCGLAVLLCFFGGLWCNFLNELRDGSFNLEMGA